MLLAPRDLCAEPFEISARQVSPVGLDTPTDWELDGRVLSEPRIMAAPNSSAFVQSLDPVTGEQAGSPVLAAVGIVRSWEELGIPTLGNGPEWGYSRRGSELYFMRSYGTSSRQLFKAFQTVTGAWSTVPLPGGTRRGLPWPSKDADDPSPRLVYAVYPRTGVQTVVPYDVATRLVPEDPATERIIPVPVLSRVGGPRWVPGSHKLVFWTPSNGSEWLALFDADTGAVEMVGPSGGPEIDEAWASVYPDGTLAVWCVMGGTEFSVWTKGWFGAWIEESWVNPAMVLGRPAKPYILSPEPFIYAGRPYIAFQLCATPGTEWQASDFWVCEPSATAACHFRMVAPESPLSRRKPEVLELDGRLVVYYIQQDAAGAHSIYQAETGL